MALSIPLWAAHLNFFACGWMLILGLLINRRRLLPNTHFAFKKALAICGCGLFLLSAFLEFYYMQSCPNSGDFYAKTRELSKHTFHLLDSHRIPYWLDFGTLLFAYRNQGMPKSDTDTDLSIELQRDGMVDILRSVFEDEGYMVKYLVNRDMLQIYFSSGLSKGPHVDIFLWRKRQHSQTNEDMMSIRDYTTRVKDRRAKDVFPLKNITFLGHSVKVPANSADILRAEYGEDFMTPRLTRLECVENFVINGYLWYYNTPAKLFASFVIIGYCFGMWWLWRSPKLRHHVK